MNIHLSAFDDGGTVRARQVAALLEKARAEFEAGARVVIGGDWNMRLSATSFPHRTEETLLSWIHDFPHAMVSVGWAFTTDVSVPSVRTLHQQYEPSTNYVTIVEGFPVSPNVVIEHVETTDLGFPHTDHHPVHATFCMRTER